MVKLQIYHNSMSEPLYMQFRTKSRTQLLDIQRAAKNLGHEVCKALIGLHSFTACDSVSAFAVRGKLAALQLMRADTVHLETFQELGQNWHVAEDLLQRLEAFTCVWYRAAGMKTDDVNELRYMVFSAKKEEQESHQLPPYADCLHKHCVRANYQARIWKLCLEA